MEALILGMFLISRLISRRELSRLLEPSLTIFGTVSILRNWEIIREFVPLRELVDEGRATPMPLGNIGQVVQIEAFMLQDLINEDASIFHRILSLLIANVDTEQE